MTLTHCRPIPARPTEIRWDAGKSFGWTLAVTAALALGPLTATPIWVAGAALATWAGVGAHVIGLHRGLIHRSYRCPRWLERTLVTVAVLNAIGGPRGLRRQHDLRDTWQRRSEAPAFYGYGHGMVQDFWWYLHCRYAPLDGDPALPARPDIDGDAYYAWLDRHRFAVQLASFAALFALGGLPALVWLGFVRVAVTKTLFWLANYLAHTRGSVDVAVEHLGEAGRNAFGLGWLSFGEAWHNNHHAFPNAANAGLRWYEVDPAYRLIQAMAGLGLAWDVTVATRSAG